MVTIRLLIPMQELSIEGCKMHQGVSQRTKVVRIIENLCTDCSCLTV